MTNQLQGFNIKNKETVMNIYFSKLIKAGERQREFNFRQHAAGGGDIYNVDVPDDKGNRVVFSMVKAGEGHWKPDAPALPQWIHGVESDLSNAIEEHMKDTVPSKKRR